jgi:DNA helicase II / ATP-dependent DNA helicase PcrA
LRWEELTERQREAASSTAAVTLVTGGAGTGKTTAALWAGRRALEADPTHPWRRALFLTFSRTAVEQIASRASRVGEIDERVEVSTFHSFGMRVLRAFGAYAGRGRTMPSVQSDAQRKLFGPNPELLTYDELVPAAIEILRSSERIRALAAERWPVVICDEFQDTSEDQWELLTLLGERARLVLLADPHQMIYTFVHGVGPERLRWAQARADLHVPLEEASHRDPTGVVPAMAAAVRERDFGHEAVRHAVATGALRVREADEQVLVESIVDEVREARRAGARSVGIYAHSNEGVARLGAALTEAGLTHSLIGIPEAQGEGVAALVVLTRFGLGEATADEVRIALATFLTSCTRGRQAPQLALLLAHGRDLPRLFAPRLDALLVALRAARPAGIAAVARVAADAWDDLGITRGVVPWRRSSYGFLASVGRLADRRLAATETVSLLEREGAQLRVGALVSDPSMRVGLTTLMNFHQTKGREADAVILVYQEGDYLTNSGDREPYIESSRVLYVALTRARQKASVILPSDPHPLIARFAQYA